MKFIISILLIALLSLTAGMFLPWWSIALAGLLVAVLIPQQPYKAFLSGFVAVLLLWSMLAYGISSSNHHILAHKISLLVLSVDNPVLLVLVTALTGALVAGFAALAGSYVRYRKVRIA